MGSLRSVRSQGILEEKAEKRRVALGRELVKSSFLRNGRHKVIQLIRRGASVNFADPETRETPLVMAVIRSGPSARILLDNGADPILLTGIGVTPLLLAVGKHDVEMVKLLLNAGAGPNLAGSNGMKPVHFALINRNDEIVWILLKAGAHP